MDSFVSFETLHQKHLSQMSPVRRIMELFRLENTSKNIESIHYKPTPPDPPLKHVHKHIYMFSEHFHGWIFHYCAGQPVSMPDHTYSEEIFSNVQSKPPLAQPEIISSYPVTCYLEEETNSHLATPFRQL